MCFRQLFCYHLYHLGHMHHVVLHKRRWWKYRITQGTVVKPHGFFNLSRIFCSSGIYLVARDRTILDSTIIQLTNPLLESDDHASDHCVSMDNFREKIYFVSMLVFFVVVHFYDTWRNKIYKTYNVIGNFHLVLFGTHFVTGSALKLSSLVCNVLLWEENLFLKWNAFTYCRILYLFMACINCVSD